MLKTYIAVVLLCVAILPLFDPYKGLFVWAVFAAIFGLLYWTQGDKRQKK